jgi:hypothetical protein
MMAKSFDFGGGENGNDKSNEALKLNEKQQSTLTRRHTITEDEAKQLDEECMQRFLKINCKIITHTKGSFDGVLIITPSALMFDPLDMPVETQKWIHEQIVNELNDYFKSFPMQP